MIWSWLAILSDWVIKLGLIVILWLLVNPASFHRATIQPNFESHSGFHCKPENSFLTPLHRWKRIGPLFSPLSILPEWKFILFAFLHQSRMVFKITNLLHELVQKGLLQHFNKAKQKPLLAGENTVCCITLYGRMLSSINTAQECNFLKRHLNLDIKSNAWFVTEAVN